MTSRPVMFHVVLPVAVGTLIYVVWRSPALLVFSWADTFGLSGLVTHIRMMLNPVGVLLPAWVLYSLPDALWVYGLTALLAVIWSGKMHTWPARAWVSVGLLLGCGGEVGQALGVVPGTFDVRDLFLSAIAAVLAYLCVSVHDDIHSRNERVHAPASA